MSYVTGGIALVLAAVAVIKVLYKMTTGIYKGNTRMSGKTVIITGANRGIGKETARELAKRGARVILACRDETRGKEAAEEVSASTRNKQVIFKQLDLSSMDSVFAFAQDVLRHEPRLDVLINNAAIVGSGVPQGGDADEERTSDGLERHYAVNHFGHFLLTNLLLPLLLRTAPARVLVVSSVLHLLGVIESEDFRRRKRHPIRIYCNTKLANVLFVEALDRRLKSTGVTVNAIHPGNTKTGIAGNLPKWLTFLGPLIKFLIVKNATEGAQTSVYGAVDPKFTSVSGSYLSDCRTSSFRARTTKELSEWLWSVSEQLTRLKEYSSRMAKDLQISPKENIDILRSPIKAIAIQRLIQAQPAVV